MSATRYLAALFLCICAASAQAADLTSADRTFLADAGASNQKEIDVSRMAQQQAASSAVKRFAATMVRDHTRLGASMNAKFGDAVVAQSASPPADLSGKTGKDFDKSYMDLMVSDHAQTLDKFERAATGAGYSTAVHKAAAGALPTIRRHARMAKSLDARL